MYSLSTIIGTFFGLFIGFFGPYNGGVANIHLKDWFVALPDPHFPCQNTKALKVAEEVLRDVKPTWNVCLGDIADLRALMPVAQYDGNDCVLEEYNKIGAWLDKLADQGTPLTHLLEGNHEARTRKAKNTKSALRAILSPQYNLDLRKRGIKWVPYSNNYKKILRVRGLTFLHGFNFGAYASAKTASHWGDVIFGHTHRVQTLTVPKGYGYDIGYNIGWLGDEEKIGYREMGDPTGWANAMAIGRLPKCGRAVVYTLLINNGKTEFAHKIYRA